METETLIDARKLFRYYGDQCAVHDVSFELKKGMVLGFLGPNGAGKSSTMQMLTGNLAPSGGEIRVCGIDLLDKPKPAKLRLGFLPEQPPLYRDLTVDEYLTYCARLHRVARSAVRASANRAKERCGLESEGRRLIANLSKGYQQRVGIAQAILHNPSVVILDEPTVGLDPIQIREIRSLIRELGQEHGIILSTHILPEVQGTCTHVQIINQGRLVFSDSIEGLEAHMHSRHLVAGFANPPVLQDVQDLSGIDSIETLSDTRLRIAWSDQNPAAAIAELAVNQGWGLTELVPERRTLEQIFIELTCQDTAAGGNTGGTA